MITPPCQACIERMQKRGRRCTAHESAAEAYSWEHLRKSERAVTDQQKNEILERLLAVWKAHPQLRLMQLIGNATDGDLYYTIEDYRLIEALEAFYVVPASSPDGG